MVAAGSAQEKNASRPKSHSAKRAKSGKKAALRRRSRAFFALFIAVVAAGLVVESVKIAQLVSVNRRIRMIAGENLVLENRVEGLNEEIRLETREEVIRYHAQKNLGMIQPTGAASFAVNSGAQERAQNEKK